MWYLWLTIGVISGSIITNIIIHIRSSYGVLRIDRSNPGKEIWQYVIDDPEKLVNKKRIFLRIDQNANLSQK